MEPIVVQGRASLANSGLLVRLVSSRNFLREGALDDLEGGVRHPQYLRRTERARCQAADWGRAGQALHIAVNVSVLQQSTSWEQVRYVLVVSGLSARCLELEITESALVSDILGALDKLHQLKAMGVELIVDDFGTEYSSFSYLKQMPVDRLKIDQSFVQYIPHNADDCHRAAILAMAANLNLEVIAEGASRGEATQTSRGDVPRKADHVLW